MQRLPSASWLWGRGGSLPDLEGNLLVVTRLRPQEEGAMPCDLLVRLCAQVVEAAMTDAERSSWDLLSELFMALSKDLKFRNSEVGEK